jgi:FAD/FMN-containing dehydrogenase
MASSLPRTEPIPPALARLRDALDGAVVSPADAAYDTARRVWNARIDVRPVAIARPGSVDGVREALSVARGEGLTIAIRGGGHSIAGHGTVDGGLVIDLGALDSIDFDPAGQVVRVGGGATWGSLDRALASHGMATVGGQISTTGVGGLTLGGGVGWLMGRYGLVVDNLRSVELVGADGRVRTVSETSEPDLFWGLRGGGGAFGIATAFELDTHPVTSVLAGTLLHPFDRATEVLRRFRDVSAEAPDELTLMALLLQAPRQPFIPETLRGRPVALFGVCWVGDPERGRTVLQPITSYGPALVDSVREMPYTELQSMFDQGSRPGFGNVWRSPFLGSLDDPAIDTIVEHAAGMPSDGSQVLLTNMGGAVARVPRDATAFPHREAPFYLEVIGKWVPGEDPAPPTAWADAFAAAIEPWSTSYTYLNFLDERGTTPVGETWDPGTRRRLGDLKRRYDPEDVFRVNHRILG